MPGHLICSWGDRGHIRNEVETQMDPEKVNRAIRECLTQCRGSSDMIAELAAYLTSLRTESGWDRGEIREVDVGVRRVLQSLVQDNTSATPVDGPVRDSSTGIRRDHET